MKCPVSHLGPTSLRQGCAYLIIANLLDTQLILFRLWMARGPKGMVSPAIAAEMNGQQ
jgi:hypothetical protein